MRFPRASSPTPRKSDAGAQHEPKASKGSGRARPSIRVLVVEDEEQLARMARIVLTQQGHEVVVAASGEDALECLESEGFNLIVSDLGLGSGQNGWDLARETRLRWPGTYFVLVTGWGAAIDPREARARGVDEVLAKPYRIADLREVADRVADALNNS
jgi:DNA-binding response OmpR family regulator